jgi:hypothetical protein
MPKQVRCLLNNCISNFLDTPQEESCANFKTETLKHLSDFKLGLLYCIFLYQKQNVSKKLKAFPLATDLLWLHSCKVSELSNFLDTPQEESCANFKTETLKHLSDFKVH